MGVPALWQHIIPAKVNVALHVLGKRAGDGYHVLDSIAAVAHGAHDTLTVYPSTHWDLQVHGPFAEGVPTDARNLLTCVATVLATHAGQVGLPPLRVDLAKHLPHGAGLGGGSMDAAAMAHGLRDYWRMAWSLPQLQQWLLPLGADIPVALAAWDAGWLRMQGIGEQVSALPQWQALRLPAVLVFGAAGLPTVQVYAATSPQDYRPALGDMPPATAAVDWLHTACGNSLQRPATQLQPNMHGLLDAVAAGEDCLFARMTGSGSAVFGVYTTPQQAEHAAIALRGALPYAWVQPVTLGVPAPQRTTLEPHA